MSDPYFTSHPDPATNGTAPAGAPGMTQQRPFDQFSSPGQPAYGYNGSSYGPPQVPTTAGSGQQPRRLMAGLVVSTLVAVVGAGATVMFHGKLGDAETKVDGLTQSLDKANESVAAKQSEVETTGKELAAAQQQSEQLGAAFQVASACASGLGEAWDLIMNDASGEEIMAAYEASLEACDQLADAQSE